MAEVEVDLECSLCKDIYREPKTLGCLHSFCLECLEIYVEKTHSNVEMKCPVCRTPFQSESREQLSNLATDSYLLHSLDLHNSLKNSVAQHDNPKMMCSDGENEATFYCLDCQDYFCEGCANAHKTVKILKNHQLIPIEEVKNQTQIHSNSQIYCLIHQQEEIKLFCNDCKFPICLLCVDQHSSHKFSAILDIIENEKQSLMDLINQVKPKEQELKEGMKKCEEMIKQLEINSTTTQTQINILFNKIRAKLDEKEQELLNKLDKMEKHRKKELELQKEELVFGIENINGSCQMIESSLSLTTHSGNVRLLSMKQLYCSRLDYLSNYAWNIEPHQNPNIDFISFEKEEESIHSGISNIGMIDPNDISAEKCTVLRAQRQKIYENEEFDFGIASCSKEGNQMKNGGYEDNFTIHIEGESMNQDEWKIIDLKNGRYEVRIKLKQKGKYLIFVRYNGIDINSSPFQIYAFPKVKPRNYNEINQPIFTFGSSGSGNGQLNSPRGVSINPYGCIYVCDQSNHRIQKFNSEGKLISILGILGNGNGNGQFSYPYGVATNSKGNILVCDQNNHRIQTFDPEGRLIKTFGSNGKENGQFSCPRGICVDLDDNILVCDHNNHRIQKFDSEGRFIFGFSGYGNDQFSYPWGIATNSNGNILVCDNGNHRIQIFDTYGRFISIFGSKGNGNGQFKNPLGICVDLNDNILVCDRNNNRVQVFTPFGEYITQFKVKEPTDITIDPKTQNIIVCGGDNKVTIY